MNTYDRTFIFSSNLFGSYEVKADIRYLNSLEDAIEYCVKNLIETLQKYNFVALIETCNTYKFHIHTHTFDEILLCKPNEIIYICDNCACCTQK